MANRNLINIILLLVLVSLLSGCIDQTNAKNQSVAGRYETASGDYMILYKEGLYREQFSEKRTQYTDNGKWVWENETVIALLGTGGHTRTYQLNSTGFFQIEDKKFYVKKT